MGSHKVQVELGMQQHHLHWNHLNFPPENLIGCSQQKNHSHSSIFQLLWYPFGPLGLASALAGRGGQMG